MKFKEILHQDAFMRLRNTLGLVIFLVVNGCALLYPLSSLLENEANATPDTSKLQYPAAQQPQQLPSAHKPVEPAAPALGPGSTPASMPASAIDPSAIRLTWSVKVRTLDSTRGVAIAPSGEVISYGLKDDMVTFPRRGKASASPVIGFGTTDGPGSLSYLYIHSRSGGDVLQTVPICRSSEILEDGLKWVDSHRAILVCKKELVAMSWPSLERKKLVKLMMDANVTAIGAKRVAIGMDTEMGKPGQVRIYDLSSGVQVAHISTRGYVEALALSPDDHLLAISEYIFSEDKGSVQIYNLQARKTLFQIETGRYQVRHIAISPDGREFLMQSRDWYADAYRLDAAAMPIRSYKHPGQWLSAIRYISPELIVTLSPALTLLPRQGEPRQLAIPSGGLSLSGLAVSSDGTLLCSSDADNHQLVCFSLAPGPSSATHSAGGSASDAEK